MDMRDTVSRDLLIEVARDLRSEQGENREYDRALVELTGFALGYDSDDLCLVRDKILTPECDYAGCFRPAQGDGRPSCVIHHNTDEGEK